MKQGELVKQLEVLYSKGIENVGSSHRSALEDRPGSFIVMIELNYNRILIKII